jgi:hypothetical protein
MTQRAEQLMTEYNKAYRELSRFGPNHPLSRIAERLAAQPTAERLNPAARRLAVYCRYRVSAGR